MYITLDNFNVISIYLIVLISLNWKLLLRDFILWTKAFKKGQNKNTYSFSSVFSFSFPRYIYIYIYIFWLVIEWYYPNLITSPFYNVKNTCSFLIQLITFNFFFDIYTQKTEEILFLASKISAVK